MRVCDRDLAVTDSGSLIVVHGIADEDLSGELSLLFFMSYGSDWTWRSLAARTATKPDISTGCTDTHITSQLLRAHRY